MQDQNGSTTGCDLSLRYERSLVARAYFKTAIEDLQRAIHSSPHSSTREASRLELAYALLLFEESALLQELKRERDSRLASVFTHDGWGGLTRSLTAWRRILMHFQPTRPLPDISRRLLRYPRWQLVPCKGGCT